MNTDLDRALAAYRNPAWLDITVPCSPLQDTLRRVVHAMLAIWR